MDDADRLEDSAEKGAAIVQRFCSPERMRAIPETCRRDFEDLGNFVCSQALAFAGGFMTPHDLQANCYRAVAAAGAVAEASPRIHVHHSD